MEMNEALKHYWLGSNKQFYSNQRVIIKTSVPKVMITFKQDYPFISDFKEFESSIINIDWLDKSKPTPNALEKMMNEAWEFLSMEEYITEKGIDVEE